MMRNVYGWLLNEAEIIGCSPIKISRPGDAMAIATGERYYSFNVILKNHSVEIRTNSLHNQMISDEQRASNLKEIDCFTAAYEGFKKYLIEREGGMYE